MRSQKIGVEVKKTGRKLQNKLLAVPSHHSLVCMLIRIRVVVEGLLELVERKQRGDGFGVETRNTESDAKDTIEMKTSKLVCCYNMPMNEGVQ